jgi:23S rRNA (cytidine1920-2'-O)/16S rRNA (cytidine1409-2'-O)-methyltransferase
MRLLDYLLSQGLAPDERSARGLIMRGDVLVNDQPVTSPAAEIDTGSTIRLRSEAHADASRGASKLRPAIERTGFDCAGRVALDLGAATGGFTQVLLEQGAARVYAVDVAYGALAHELRQDPRVVVLERTNARNLVREHLPEPPSAVVGDLSFISWAAVLPTVVPLLADEAELLLLVKPQFELAARGKSELVPGGVVRDAAVIHDCLVGLYNTWVEQALGPQAVVPAAVRGAKGNQEYFVYLQRGKPGLSREGYSARAAEAIAEATP